MIDVEGKELEYEEGRNVGVLEPKVYVLENNKAFVSSGDTTVPPDYAICVNTVIDGVIRNVMWYWFRECEEPPGTEEEMMQLAQAMVDLCYLRRSV